MRPDLIGGRRQIAAKRRAAPAKARKAAPSLLRQVEQLHLAIDRAEGSAVLVAQILAQLRLGQERLDEVGGTEAASRCAGEGAIHESAASVID